MIEFFVVELSRIGSIASIVAAVVAIFIAIWTITRDMRDKGRLKVECGYAIDRQALESGAYDKAAIAVFRITNEGRQTITVEKISISLVGQRGYLSWDHKNIPRSLQPSEFVVEHFDYDFEKTLPCEVMVVDTYGKKWRAPKDEVINLRSRPRHQNSDLAESISEETQLE